MYKETKSIERYLSNKYVLGILVLFVYIVATILLNIALNVLSSLFQSLKSFQLLSMDSVETIPPLTFSVNWIWDFSFRFWYVYLFAYLIIGVVSAKKMYHLYKSFRDINTKIKGTARFTTKEEIKSIYKAVKDDNNVFEGASGIPVTHCNDELYIDTNNTNTLVVASTQSGKTETFSYPLLDITLRATIKDSIVITDIKGDMVKNTKAEFEKRGYAVHVLNLINPNLSMSYNPLELIKQAYIKGDYAKAQTLCNTLSYSLFHNPNSKDPFWEESAIALVNALILAICDLSLKQNTPEKITMFTLTVMLSELGSDPDEDGMTKLDHFFASYESSHPAKLQYATIRFSTGVTRSGIFTSTMVKLKNYTYENIAKMTATSSFQIEDIAYGEKPIALFIVYPDWDDSNYSIISTFLSQINAVLSEKATLSANSTLPRRVRFLFEEVGNIPAIEGLDRSMAVGLSRGLLYCLVIQSLAQLDGKYGKEVANSITGNCGNQIYIMSDDFNDAEEFSKKLGVKSVVVSDRSGQSLSADKTFSEKEEDRQLMMPDELRRLRKGEWVFLRTKKREDHEKNRVSPFPIYSSLENGTHMLHRYEYLMDRFNHTVTFDQLGIESEHQFIDLSTLLLQFIVQPKEQPKKKYKKKAKDESNNDIPFEQLDDVYETNEIPPPPYDMEDESIDYSFDNVDEIHGQQTPLSAVLTNDQIVYLQAILKKELSDDEYQYFIEIDSYEHLEAFLTVDSRTHLFEKVRPFLLDQKEGVNNGG